MLNFFFNELGTGWEAQSRYTGMQWRIDLTEGGNFRVLLENEHKKSFPTFRDAVMWAETKDMQIKDDSAAALEAV